MHNALLQQVVIWVWLVAAVAAVGIVGFQFGATMRNDSYEFDNLTVGLLGQQAALGLLFFTLNALGHPLLAQWSWRVLAIASVIMAFTALLKPSRFPGRSAPLDSEKIAFMGALVCSIFLAISSFFVTSRSNPVSLAGGVTWSAQTVIDVAIAVSLLLCALLTMLFTYRFLNVVRREGGLSLEFIDGGIGGGSRVGRVPVSVTYLLGMVLSGAVFVMLLLHEEARIFRLEPKPEAAKVETAHIATAPAAAPETAVSAAAKPVQTTPETKPQPSHTAKPE